MAYRDGFLFDFGEIGDARRFHECDSQQEAALNWLRRQDLPKVSFEKQHPGARLAPSILRLRKAWGFTIVGDGSVRNPYKLPNRSEWPSMVEVTDKMKEAYYASEHWQKTRRRRLEHDKYMCVMCTAPEPATCVHHVKYDLFNESIDDLISLCDHHHEMVHDNSLIAFPMGVDVSIAERLLGVASYKFEEWLLPIGS